MTGVCVDGHDHLVQNGSDLDGIAMRVHDEVIKIFIFSMDLVVGSRAKEAMVWRCWIELSFVVGDGVVVEEERDGAVEGEEGEEVDGTDGGRCSVREAEALVLLRCRMNTSRLFQCWHRLHV